MISGHPVNVIGLFSAVLPLCFNKSGVTGPSANSANTTLSPAYNKAITSLMFLIALTVSIILWWDGKSHRAANSTPTAALEKWIHTWWCAFAVLSLCCRYAVVVRAWCDLNGRIVFAVLMNDSTALSIELRSYLAKTAMVMRNQYTCAKSLRQRCECQQTHARENQRKHCGKFVAVAIF